MKYSLYLGRVLGVKIYVHWTFLLLIGWIVFSNARAGLGLTTILWTVALVLAVFACIVLHELGHAMAARQYKVVTKHITLLPIGGVAQLETIPENPKEELVIALAGPAVNFIIAILLAPFANIGNLMDSQSLTTVAPDNFLYILISINVWLAVFNLIPAFPMDGGRVLRALLSFKLGRVKATRFASVAGQLFGAIFIFAGFIYNPMLIFIGLFVFLSGQYESNMVETVQFLHNFKVHDVLMREIPVIENNSTIKSASQALLNTQNKNFVVTANGEAVGTISREEIFKALEENNDDTLVEEVKNKNLTYVSENMALDEAWKMMQQTKKPLVLVGTSSHLEGIVEEENIAEFIMLQTSAQKRGSL